MSLIARQGEYLKETSLRITDEQLVLSEPKTIAVRIWRYDEAQEKPFEIQLGMPWGNLYVVARYETRDEAEQAYEKVSEQLRNGTAAIEAGGDFRVVTR